MPFKGNISKGSRVEAELTLAADANGSALIAISFADNDGGSGEDSTAIAPGGQASVRVHTNSGANGRLRVFVDFNDNADTAQLVVRVNGTVRDDETITGDTSWAYSLS
jgi:hypothetical protein